MSRNASHARPATLCAAVVLLASVSAGGSAWGACKYTYGTLSSTKPNLGNVVAGAVGDTVFRIAATSGGAVSKVAGSGARTSAGGSPVTMTIATGAQGDCQTSTISGTLSATGASTGRAGAMTNFDVGGSSGVTVTGESGSSVRTFTLAPLGRNATRVLYLGMDFPNAGDDAGGPTGAAKASYALTLIPSKGNSITRAGTGVATVRRALKLKKWSDLSFGRVVKPTSGTGTVSLNPTTGLRTVSGNTAVISVPAPTRAAYTVTGEGGRQLSVYVPPTTTMTSPGGSLEVDLTSFRPPIRLSGGAGGSGSYEFWVGGALSVPSSAAGGAYSGAFVVTISYN